MKKIAYLFMLAVIGMSAAVFNSCSDDENGTDGKNEELSIEKDLAGDYKGTLQIKVDKQPVGNVEAQIVEVKKAGDQSINLSVKDFNFATIKVGNVYLKDSQLVKSGDRYTFTGKTSIDVNPLKGDVDAKGTIGGGKLDISLDIDADLSGTKQEVTVTYSGSRQ